MADPTDRALKPCPFCGAAVELRWDDEHGYGGFVACSTTDCPVSPTGKHDKAATITAWNRRAAEIDASKPITGLRMDGSDWLDYAVTPNEKAQREAHFAKLQAGSSTPAPAEAVEALRRALEETQDSMGPLDGWAEFAERMYQKLEAALAARPAAVGGDDPVGRVIGVAEVSSAAFLHSPLPVGTKLYTQPQQLAVTDGYYLASFKRKGYGGEVWWWGPNNAGYTPDLEQAGIYTEIHQGYHDSEYTVPVPVSFIRSLRVRRVVDPGDSLNGAFHSAKSLRAALAALPHLARKETA